MTQNATLFRIWNRRSNIAYIGSDISYSAPYVCMASGNKRYSFLQLSVRT